MLRKSTSPFMCFSLRFWFGNIHGHVHSGASQCTEVLLRECLKKMHAEGQAISIACLASFAKPRPLGQRSQSQKVCVCMYIYICSLLLASELEVHVASFSAYVLGCPARDPQRSPLPPQLSVRAPRCLDFGPPHRCSGLLSGPFSRVPAFLGLPRSAAGLDFGAPGASPGFRASASAPPRVPLAVNGL